MNFSKTSCLLLVIALCAIVVVSAQESSPNGIEQIQQQQPQQQQESTDNGQSHRRGFSSLFGTLLKPIRSSIAQARQFLSNRLGNVSDGVDRLRMQSFKLFTNLYNKTYSPEEIPRRMKLFFERRNMIEQSVKMFNEGKSLFAMRENAFTDWDDEELKRLTGVSLPSRSELAREEEELGINDRHTRSVDFEIDDGDDTGLLVKQDNRIPASKDWRASGCISTPINQLKCGACYAIATVSVVESMRCIHQVSSPILSPQQIVDCATPRAGYSNYGCDGGWPTRVLKYLQNTRVAARETCYPFVRRQNICKLNQIKSVAGCTVSASPSDTTLKYKVLNNERDVLYHVAKTGPVVTVMKASDKFLYYGSGIFDDSSCSRQRDDVDHAIVIVGYGRESGVDYWIIKNSWGVKEWGENGYGKFKRGTNACSIGHWGWVITS